MIDLNRATNSAAPGFFESNPVLTTLLLLEASRRNPNVDKVNLSTAIGTPANRLVSGQVLDSLNTATAGSSTGTINWAALIQALIADLPTIIALIMSLLGGVVPPVVGPSQHTGSATAMPTDFAIPEIPPSLIALLEQAVITAVQAAIPAIEADLKAWLLSIGIKT